MMVSTASCRNIQSQIILTGKKFLYSMDDLKVMFKNYLLNCWFDRNSRILILN